MCDFAHDPEEVRKLLVGRVLTVERVRQLNAKDYFYQMLKDNPEMLKIRPGVENELLEGAIDTQASLWSYIDDFRYLALLCFATVPIAFGLKKVSSRKAVAAH